MSQVEDLKKKGNEALQKGDIDGAINFYSEALKLDPNNHILWSNRAAAYATKKDWKKSLEDALQCVKLQPNFGKVLYQSCCKIYRTKEKARTYYRSSTRTLPSYWSPLSLFLSLFFFRVLDFQIFSRIADATGLLPSCCCVPRSGRI